MVHIEPGQEKTRHQIDYQQFIENMPIAVYTCDAEGYISSYNKQAAEMWGKAPKIGEDQFGSSWKVYKKDGSNMAPEDNPVAITIKERRPVSGCELMVVRPCGERRLVAPHTRPLYDEKGNFTGAVNIVEDITNQKANEEDIARLAAIVASSHDAIIGHTQDWTVTSWNAAAERTFGYTAAEMIGESLNKIIPKEQRVEKTEIQQLIEEGEQINHFQTKRITKDNRVLDISMTISPIKNSEGAIVGASKIARDITQEKEKERIMRQEEERFRMAVEATGLGTWDYCPQTGELLWSPECRNIYDIPEDIVVNYDLFLGLVHPEDTNMVTKAVAAAMDPAGDGKYDVLCRILRYSDRHTRWIRGQGKVYFNTQGVPERFIGTILDITEDKLRKEDLEKLILQRTNELQQANTSLQQINKELEEFTHIVGHDLQEPLRKIRTYADRLRLKHAEMPDMDVELYLEKIIHSSVKMSGQIKALLGYALLNNVDQRYEKTDLNEVFQIAEENLESMIRKENAIIHRDELPTIESLPQQMQQLFYNLLSNSLKFRSEERIPVVIITCRTLTRSEIAEMYLDSRTEYYKIDVSDNGMGFDSKYNNRVFTIFQRLNHKEDYPGTGIGLALCKKITDAHKGLLLAKGKENRGAKFTVILPARQVL